MFNSSAVPAQQSAMAVQSSLRAHTLRQRHEAQHRQIQTGASHWGKCSAGVSGKDKTLYRLHAASLHLWNQGCLAKGLYALSSSSCSGRNTGWGMLFQGAHTQDSHLSGSSTWGSASCIYALQLSCDWERLFTAIPYMMWLGLSSMIGYKKLCCQPDLVCTLLARGK